MNYSGKERELLDLEAIQALDDYQSRLSQLLFRRHILTNQLGEHSKCYPPLIFDRACTYEALEYDDLAAFDAYTVYMLCQKQLSDEFVTDLEAYNQDGKPWEPETNQVRHLIVDAIALLVRCLNRLSATRDAQEKLEELQEHLKLLKESESEVPTLVKLLERPGVLHPRGHLEQIQRLRIDQKPSSRFGSSRREIYPWSTYEPDRNSPESVLEINKYLSTIASNLEAKVTTLPALDSFGKSTDEKWHQLGLFAKQDLSAGEEILREKSILTAIRPPDASICDACGQELESISFDEIRQCDGEDCDITYCSQECKERAVNEYHRPYLEEDDTNEDEDEDEDEDGVINNPDIAVKEEGSTEHTDNNEIVDGTITEDNSSSTTDQVGSPFCGNTDLHTIGRPLSTTDPITAEWDLYFLLLVRTVAMSVTQDTHPLDLKETKYLWGDFTPSPSLSATTSPSSTHSLTLPFSLTHTIQQPLDYFVELSNSYAPATPYSRTWLERYDPWILQTLYAKFRGVANAQQSTFDGLPEIAAVHPGWCLANHSCAPNVRWTPTGVRRFYVVDAGEAGVGTGGKSGQEKRERGAKEMWKGIRKGEEVFSHYTDVRLTVDERRERLREVLGGICRCERCLRESREQ
ncbi:hypothetical protein H2198_009157 [Neophaeococcomyces mojaviensis]|uniref:Uncharacterized protein n=1 Tax=Neophaeococcomyces mojaviensis TaxID=3383035 RepID=A0ACC2ZVK4_9EURO|nr:hypothetical protein H2198_009157 [Knufia sp. JES_112]